MWRRGHTAARRWAWRISPRPSRAGLSHVSISRSAAADSARPWSSTTRVLVHFLSFSNDFLRYSSNSLEGDTFEMISFVAWKIAVMIQKKYKYF